MRLCHHFCQRRLLVAALSIVTVFGFVLLYTGDYYRNFYYLVYPEDGITCYRADAPSLADISEMKPPKGKSIFFHETSCRSFLEGRIVINSRQACAVESAAKWNPRHSIYLTFASPAQIRHENTTSNHFLKALASYENVYITHLNYPKYLKGTPLEQLYESGKIESSLFARSHASDILRYLTLYKHGGIYLDLDVIVVRSLETLPANFAGSESETNVAAGVLGFSSTGVGHRHAKSCVDDLEKNFKGNDWGNNGPGVITRLLRRVCGVEKARDMLRKDCEGFKVYPPDHFYPVAWWNWTKYFKEEYLEEVLRRTEKSYAVHVWNKHSADTKVPTKDGRVPYVYFAKRNCPRVFQACGEYF